MSQVALRFRTSMPKDLMAEGESPAVARRRVRLALREAREAAGYTQAEVAEQMEWSLSKVIRIENGDVSIAPNDLRPLLIFLNVRDRATVGNLVESAKIARTRPGQRQAWYQAPEFREHLTDAMRKLMEYDAEARFIKCYSVFHVPGLLQIPEYSRALTGSWTEELTAEQISFRVEARRRRRDAILGRVGQLRISALLDESVFRRNMGSPAILAAELRELLRLSEMGLLAVRVIQFSADVAMSYNAAFDILFLREDGDLSNAVMYHETGTSDEILEDPISKATSGPPPPGAVARHYDRYQKLWNGADSEADTIDFIERRIRELGDQTVVP
jgi:transcriptional regulator with XRE-family HTH domain